MKLGDIVTKEQFLRLAPLGLQITSMAPGGFTHYLRLLP